MGKPRDNRHKDLFRPALDEIIDLDHALARLGSIINLSGARRRMLVEVGFGGEVRNALDRRQAYLIQEGLARSEGSQVTYRSDLLRVLRQRELRQSAAALSDEPGKAFAPARPGGRIEGIYRRPVKLASGKFALIEKSQEFALVPWRDVLERRRGQKVNGIGRSGGIFWSFQKKRGLGVE